MFRFVFGYLPSTGELISKFGFFSRIQQEFPHTHKDMFARRTAREGFPLLHLLCQVGVCFDRTSCLVSFVPCQPKQQKPNPNHHENNSKNTRLDGFFAYSSQPFYAVFFYVYKSKIAGLIENGCSHMRLANHQIGTVFD